MYPGQATFFIPTILPCVVKVQNQTFYLQCPLQPIRVGETVILKNIFFDTDKFNLKEESRSELAKLIQLLKGNPGIHIEISGHTDNQGTADYNLVLSRNRPRQFMITSL